MLISHKHKFITIDIPKTGTCSLRTTLAPLDIIDVFAVGGEGDEKGSFYQHDGIIRCRKTFIEKGWDINEYTVFSMIRNPWERYASFLLYALARIKRYEESKEKLSPLGIGEGFALTRAFERHNRDEHSFFRFLIHQYDSQCSYILDDNNDLAADIIGRMEKIEDSFKVFCDTVNISHVPELDHANKSNYEKPYSDYYNQEFIDIVAEKEKFVIDKFGYEYE